jgi:membrane protein
VNEWIDRARRFIDEDMWRGTARWVRFLQFCFVVGQGFVRDQLPMRAHSLTYITVLSVIPLLAVGLSVAGMLGLREVVTEQIRQRMSEIAPQVAEQILRLVTEFDFKSLGALGGTFLFLTTIMTVGSVERSFNSIWGISKQRTWMRRLPDYLFVILFSPLVLGVALSLGTTLQSQSAVQWLLAFPGFGLLYEHGLKQLPLALFVGGFMFLYWFLPNTKVRPMSAALGGLVAGVAFPVAIWSYVGFSVGAAKMGAIFGSFAQLPLFLVFTYFAWSIVLLGAEVSFAYQSLGRYRREVRGAVPGPASRESIGLGIALEVARRFDQSGEPLTADALCEALDVRVRTIREILDALEGAGIVAELSDEDRAGQYQLGRPAERISVRDVLTALRGERDPLVPAVDQVFERIEKRLGEVVEHETLADLLRQ